MPDQKMQYDVGGVMLERPFKIDRLGHLGLYHEDIDAAGRFYSSLLGFRHTDVLGGDASHPAPRGYFYTHNTDHHTLALITADLARSRSNLYDKGITVNQLSFQVGTLEEMINAHRMLRERGVVISRVGRDRPGSNWAVYFQDPDGHTVELFYGMEQIGWDGRSKPMETFAQLRSLTEPTLPQASEADELEALEALGKPMNNGHLSRDLTHGQYVVGGISLPRPFRIIRNGPVALFVRDVEASTRFYGELLGLRVTEETVWESHRSSFLRIAGEHHTIALHPLELRARLHFQERTTLMCQGLQVASWRQLRDAAAYLRQHGCEEIEVPASLHPGIDHAVHFMGPEGHCFRLYHDIESIGWDGKPRPAALRRHVQVPWPEVLDDVADPYAHRSFMGPLG